MSSVEELGAEIGRVSGVKRSSRKEKVTSSERSEAAESVVQLSDKGFSLENIKKSIKELPDIPANRIKVLDDLKEQIKNGQYHVDHQKLDVIASKLLEGSELGLGLFN